MNKGVCFNVIVTVYNAEPWIGYCLYTILQQSYKNYKLVVVNDASTDKTGKIIDNMQTRHGFEVIHRNENEGVLKNIIDGANKICEDDNDVIVKIDGDDWLYFPGVFEFLGKLYCNKNLWLTYGQFVFRSNLKRGISREVKNTRTYRKKGLWTTSHLRTFRYHLFKKINDADLRMADGSYYKAATDPAIMYPMVEMAGLDRIKFIDDILYVYNDNHNLSTQFRLPGMQSRNRKEIISKRPYKQLP